MNIRQLLDKALRDLGADGLVNLDIECGCGLDELVLCDYLDLDECVLAKRTTSGGGGFIPMEDGVAEVK